MFTAEEAIYRSKLSSRGYAPTKKMRYFDIIRSRIIEKCDHGLFALVLNNSDFSDPDALANMNNFLSDLHMIGYEAAIIANDHEEPYALYITWGKDADERLMSMIDERDHIFLY